MIVKLEGGAGTTYLFEHVAEGSELTLRGPQGVFTLPDVIDRDLFFICTGTGVAPFRSMATYLHEHNVPHKNIYLLFGCRLLCDTLYGAELRELEKVMPGFHYMPTYSREKTEDASLRKGYVHNIYQELLQHDHRPAYFFLCGWKSMVDEAKQRILQLGYDKKDIHLELYG